MARAEYITGLASAYGNSITTAVREFAQEYNLTAEVWVHDFPLWFVSSIDADHGIARRVQIGAYRLDTSEEVRMVPQVYRLDNQLRRLVAFDHIGVELIEKMSLNAATEPKNVKQQLAQAWGKALKMEPPSSNPTSAVIYSVFAELSPVGTLSELCPHLDAHGSSPLDPLLTGAASTSGAAQDTLWPRRG